MTLTGTRRLWGYIGDREHPYNAFDYSPDHRGRWPQGSSPASVASCRTDAYSGCDAVFAEGKVIEVGCMARGRRKFHDAEDSDPSTGLWRCSELRPRRQLARHW